MRFLLASALGQLSSRAGPSSRAAHVLVDAARHVPATCSCPSCTAGARGPMAWGLQHCPSWMAPPQAAEVWGTLLGTDMAKWGAHRFVSKGGGAWWRLPSCCGGRQEIPRASSNGYLGGGAQVTPAGITMTLSWVCSKPAVLGMADTPAA